MKTRGPNTYSTCCQSYIINVLLTTTTKMIGAIGGSRGMGEFSHSPIAKRRSQAFPIPKWVWSRWDLVIMFFDVILPSVAYKK